MKRQFALVRIHNSKYTERYSEPILKADTLEEMELKLSSKTGASTKSDEIGSGLMDIDLGGWP